jgi:hypothetical protein
MAVLLQITSSSVTILRENLEASSSFLSGRMNESSNLVVVGVVVFLGLLVLTTS